MKYRSCKDCTHLRLLRRSFNSRCECMCEHPNREYIRKYYEEHNIRRFEGFICYTKPYTIEPATKTSPRWCPLRVECLESEVQE